MTVEITSAPRPPALPSATAPWHRTVSVALVALATGAAMLSGYGLLEDQKKLAILPVVAVVGVSLTVVGLTRFGWFVLLLLAIRSSTDALKLSGSNAGTSAGNTVGARGLDPSSILGVLFLVLAILWLAANFYGRKPVRPSVVSVMLVGYVAAGALSVLSSTDAQASALQLARLTSGALMFIVLERLITDRVMLKRVLVACFIALLIPFGYTVFGLATGQGSEEVKGGFTRLTGTFAQSNDYARFLTFLLLLGIAVLPYVNRRVKPFLVAALIPAAVFLLLTLTLGAIGAACAGIVVIALLQRRFGLLALLGAGGVAALIVVPGLIGRITDSTTASQVGGDPTGNSLAWRLQFWGSLLSINKDNPITGVGLNATQYFSDSAKQPHNDYLSAYIETGVIGLLMYLGLVAAMLFVTARAVVRTRRGTLEWAVSVGAFACVAVFAVMSLAANVIQSSANFWYILAITACASAAGRFGGRSGRGPETDVGVQEVPVGPEASLEPQPPALAGGLPQKPSRAPG